MRNDNGQSDGDCGVCKVEGGPVPVAPVKIDEVPNRANTKPVQDVLECAADREPEPRGPDWLLRANKPQEQ